MKKIIIAFSLLCLIGNAAGSTLIHNINGYTMNDGVLVRFSALEFDQGRVTRLYRSASDSVASKATDRVDGGGATLLPGLADSHGHVGNFGWTLRSVKLVGSTSESEAVARVKSYIADQPGQEWVMGRGWNQVLWQAKAFPTRQSLDTLGEGKYILLDRVDGHAVWVNSAVLQKAGIDRDTADPEGGQIVRDAQGNPTGVLIDNAMDIAKAIVPPVDDKQMQSVLLAAMDKLAEYGITTVHEAQTSAQYVRVFQDLNAKRQMPIRIYGMLDVLDPDNDQYLEQGPIIDPKHMLDIRSVKISADGALGSRGAALHQDYSDAPGHRGLLLLTDTQLEHHIGRAMQAGYQVNTHAIGDLSNDKVLDYYDRLVKKYEADELRHRIEHAQVLQPQDVSRLAKSNIIASIQPTHATSDMNMAGDRLGETRLKGAYAWKQLQDSGARLAGGSDFPVESPNPFFGLHAAVTRQDHNNLPAGGWLPGEKLSREAALSLFTEGAAYAAHQEEFLGRLMPGYYADFILVRDDYFTVPETQIWKNEVLATYIAGQRVYASGAN